MKQFFTLIFCIQLCISCNSQNNDNFNLFLNKFIVSEYPINPIDVFLALELKMQTKQILEADFNKYLKAQNDTNWIFDKNHDYTFGGKFNINPDIICVFYRRDYMPDDINEQIGEVIICTFNHKGEKLSNMPIAGGYGDSITFTSIINSTDSVEVKYTKYETGVQSNYSKHFFIEDTGKIIELDR